MHSKFIPSPSSSPLSSSPFMSASLSARAHAFVDGENLRGVIRELFAPGGRAADGPGVFDPYEYLPRGADWGGFFREVVARAGQLAGAPTRWTRTYWYVIEDIDTMRLPARDHPEAVAEFLDERLRDALKFADWQRAKAQRGVGRLTVAATEAAVRWLNARLRKKHGRPPAQGDAALLAVGVPAAMLELVDEMWERRRQKEREFRWKRERESAIERAGPIRFRRSGHIRFNPLTGQLGQEKTTDVNLALDLLLMKDNYDLAVIVSGDQDFVPAVRAAQDAGKTVVTVAFLDQNGRMLPGGAKRLSAAADWSVEIPREEFRAFLNLPEKKSPPAAGNGPAAATEKAAAAKAEASGA